MKPISLLVLVLFIGLLITPALAEETLTNSGASIYIKPTLAVKGTITKVVTTAAPTIEPTAAPTTAEPTPEITEIPVTAVPTTAPVTIVPTLTQIQETIEKLKPAVWKDTTPKISKNKLSIGTAQVQRVKVMDADNKNITISEVSVTNNQIDLPFDVSKPGKIAVKMQIGDVVYVIRRDV
jgi:hypothetical protein